MICGILTGVIRRDLEPALKKAARAYGAVAILGPRQSGKTTLAKAVFPRKRYVSLEEPHVRSFAEEDPRRFLAQFQDGAILDEIQRVPVLFSYLQGILDTTRRGGLFVLTGSQNFGLVERITQSLAGRISLNRLLPFSLGELEVAKALPPSLDVLLFTGGYPAIYDKSLSPTDWLANYVETYVERDVRSLKNVGDLSLFQRFLRFAAGRCGQLVNLSSLAADCGISHNTVRSWLSILEASFLVFLLPPHFKNFNKRLRKSPKLYFFDTGLLCYLLGIARVQDLAHHSMRGAIFESFVLSELVKRRLHRARPLNLYFWQDKTGREVDCLIEQGERLLPLEIKSGQTLPADAFQNLRYWRGLSKGLARQAIVVTGGEERQDRRDGLVLGWREIDRVPF